MYTGSITCQCGQQFYCESVNDTIACPKCGAIHKLTNYEEVPSESSEEQS